MDEVSESKLLESFNQRASKGEVITVEEIHKKYEEVLQKKITKSSIYKLLSPHSWHQVFPRPQHPKQNKEDMEAFKKLWLSGYLRP